MWEGEREREREGEGEMEEEKKGGKDAAEKGDRAKGDRRQATGTRPGRIGGGMRREEEIRYSTTRRSITILPYYRTVL